MTGGGNGNGQRLRRRRPLLRKAVVIISTLAFVASLTSLAIRVAAGDFDPDFASGSDPALGYHSGRLGRGLRSYSTAEDKLVRRNVGDVDAEARDKDGDDSDNCTEELHDSEEPSLRHHIALPLLTFVCLYMFLALAIACDDCFVPALEYLSSHFGLSDDVAGATLMAAGGSAPELFTSLVGTFQREAAEGIAVGTVLGSAVFNVLFVIGACSFAVPRNTDLRLKPYPLLRDCSCYVVGLATLATFAGLTSPGIVEPWEAAIMFGLYCGYVAFMAYGNGGVEAWFKSKFDGNQKVHAVLAGPADGQQIVSGKKAGDVMRNVKAALDGRKYFELPTVHASERTLGVDVGNGRDVADADNDIAPSPPRRISGLGSNHTGATGTGEEGDFQNEGDDLAPASAQTSFDDTEQPAGETSGEADDHGSEENEDGGPLLDRLTWCPSTEYSCLDRVSHVAQLPLVALLGFTIPYVPPPEEDDDDSSTCETNAGGVKGGSDEAGDVRVTERQRTTTCRAFAAFLLSICWIGTFTYIMVRCAELIGLALGVPNAVMGLTVLATGASVPDMLSAVCVAKKGRGDMAVSCTVGSNIFDLLLGLPVPWLLSFAAPGYSKYVQVGTDDMVVSILVLVGMLVSTLVAMKCLRWRMGRGLGVAMFSMFVVFQLQAVLRELPFDQCHK